MTTEELFTDLKQFITATVSQQTADLGTRIDRVEQRLDNVERNMEERFELVDEKLNEIQSAIGEALESTDTKLQDHEDRLVRLERRPA